ncbi:probable glutathione peroxidase 8 isoform X3 [Prionailurus viverrinus]|uniref:Glutathione peroxidase 8 (putative) n=3 Tax=Felidae TaxID=9681 RepID=A0A8C9JJY8_PANTA|nr:probable glutathione peroxidase 8 isoform X4 [Puma concolor]XP_026897782.1 probable glutathione peroxidase 8 isoform X2 [Acinonyx jubatus]XP_030176847.1 probable glutathione peroxidase 8 isoform X2 [Lynx canadensis]XP_040309235.1 probable glutathione peroxidase 8 isoform X3 [Puma yagouaroundi]XP_043446438.1 probable glutathione peroxidase 8 isoform X3 [Prionailurus bengalensis]XP_044916671.1 probable glutathione peroxidase 8 isoform X3 [Felis catus]XP_045349240.1 probable glutathione perox
MEPLTAYPLRCSGPKAKVFAVLLSMVLCTVMLFLLQLKFLKPKINSFYAFEVKDAKGRTVSLEKFKGKILQRKNQGGIFGSIWSTLRVKL